MTISETRNHNDFLPFLCLNLLLFNVMILSVLIFSISISVFVVFVFFLVFYINVTRQLTVTGCIC